MTRGEELLKVDSDRKIVAASMIKVPIMLAAVMASEQKTLFLDMKKDIKHKDKIPWSVITDLTISRYSIRDLITLMICYSDNTATNRVIDIIGMDEINCSISFAGLKNTVLKRYMMDAEARKYGLENMTTPEEMAKIFEIIYKTSQGKDNLKGKLSQVSSVYMMNTLRKQKDNTSLKRFLDEDIKVAHKTGGLEGLNHDMGIFKTVNGEYLLGVFTWGAQNNYETKDFIGEVSRKIYNIYTS